MARAQFTCVKYHKAQHNEKTDHHGKRVTFTALDKSHVAVREMEKSAPHLRVIMRRARQAVLLSSQPEAETMLKSAEVILKGWWEKRKIEWKRLCETLQELRVLCRELLHRLQ